MSESEEKRELGGLAKSIDALFSQRPSAPVVDEPEAGGVAEVRASEPDMDAGEPEPDAAGPEAGVGVGQTFRPDPFDSLDAVEEIGPAVGDVVDRAGLEDSDSLGLAEVDTPEDVAWEPAEEEAQEDDGVGPSLGLASTDEPVGGEVGLSPPEEPSLGDELLVVEATDDLARIGTEAAEPAGEAPKPADTPPAKSPGPPGSALAEAVDTFLAGHPGAAAEVESLSRQLHERLALDPLADAVERLVLAADETEDDPALLMAGKIANPAVASRLVQRMAVEEDEKIRARYVGLAARLGMVMANAFKGALTDKTDSRTRRICYDGLIGMGDEARPVIEAMIEDDNRFLVRNGVAILGEMGGEGAAELVTSALANTDFRVRREAITSLARLGGDDSDQLVMASLEDPDATVRAAAAEAAGKLGIERALKPMLALLEDDSVPDDERIAVQVQTLRGLGQLGDPGAVQAIEKRAVGSLFSKPSTEVRIAAYQALHAIGTPHARELIEKAKSDKDPVVRTTVRGLDAE